MKPEFKSIFLKYKWKRILPERWKVFSHLRFVLCFFLFIVGGSPPQPVVPAHKDKSGAPPVRSIYDDISSPGLGSTPLTSRRQVTNIPLFIIHNNLMFLCGCTVRISNLKCFSEVCFSVTVWQRISIKDIYHGIYLNCVYCEIYLKI